MHKQFLKKHHHVFYYPIPLLTVYEAIDKYFSQPSGFLNRKPISGRTTGITTFEATAGDSAASIQSFHAPMEGELWEVKGGCFLHLLVKPSWAIYALFYTGILLFTVNVFRYWNSSERQLEFPAFVIPVCMSLAGIIAASITAEIGKARFVEYIDREIRKKIYGRDPKVSKEGLAKDIIVRYLFYADTGEISNEQRDYDTLTKDILALANTKPDIHLLCNHLMDLQATGLNITPDRSHCSQVARMILKILSPKINNS